jgi:hypothetical protein
VRGPRAEIPELGRFVKQDQLSTIAFKGEAADLVIVLQRQLENPVRTEIETALAFGTPLIPVSVLDAKMSNPALSARR